MTQPELEVVWAGGNSFDLLGWNETAYGDVLCEALGDGTEWGNPESIRRTLHRALAAGSALAKDGTENRTVTVRLRLSAADARALAGGEAVLHMLDEQRRVELHWTQPDEYAVPVAFIAVAVDLKRDYSGTWDTDENLVRQTWTLTFTCLPHVLSTETIAVDAPPPFVAAPSTLDDCTSTAGWYNTNPANVTLTVASGGVDVTVSPTTWDSEFSISIPMPAMAERYLAIEAPTSAVINAYPFFGASALPPAGREGKWWFYDVDGLSAISDLVLTFGRPGTETWPAIRLLTIAETATPALTAGRQSLRIIPTPGSVSTSGSLVVEARNADTDGTGDSLGTAIVYTGTDYDPRLSAFSIGTRSADSSALSGSNETGTSFVFDRPANSIPVGSYAVYVHASSASTTDLTWTLTSAVTPPGAAAGVFLASSSDLSASTTSVGTAYNLLNLGSLDLPGFDVGVASDLDLRFILSCSASVAVDEVLLFNRSTGRLIIADTSTIDRPTETAGVWSVTPNNGATRMWLDAASLEGSERVIAGSPSKEMSLPLHLNTELIAYDGAPIFTPGNTYVYVGTTGTIEPVVTGEFRPAAHSSLAE